MVLPAKGKTGALLGCACALGAWSGGGGPEQVEQMRDIGEHLGLEVKFVDDLLDIWVTRRDGRPGTHVADVHARSAQP